MDSYSRQGNLADLRRLRLLLVTGKGGVGKTTLAAALARAFATSGKRTLCVEVVDDESDEAPLATVFGRERHAEAPIEVAPNLFVAGLSAASGHKAFLRDTLPVRVLADAAMKSQAVRRFLQAAPTFPELGVLYRLLTFTRERTANGKLAFDHVVVDLPATGHALALVQVPASVLRVVTGGAIGQAVRSGLDLLCDRTQTAALAIALPEPLAVTEALELARGLEASGVNVPGIVLNRLPRDPFVGGELEAALELSKGKSILGARTALRIARARESRKRIAAERPLLAELFEHDGDPVSELSQILAQDRAEERA